MSQNFGMKVVIEWNPLSKYYNEDRKKTEYRNITEIHYNYRVSQIGGWEKFNKFSPDSFLREVMVAFESDIHHTGFTYAVSDILEFYTYLETEKKESI
jgi:hypothetical protein